MLAIASWAAPRSKLASIIASDHVVLVVSHAIGRAHIARAHHGHILYDMRWRIKCLLTLACE